MKKNIIIFLIILSLMILGVIVYYFKNSGHIIDYNPQIPDIPKELFNSSLEELEGNQTGENVINLLDEVISRNKGDFNEVQNFTNGIEVKFGIEIISPQNIEELELLKDKIEKSKIYTIFLEYDTTYGLIYKITINEL